MKRLILIFFAFIPIFLSAQYNTKEFKNSFYLHFGRTTPKGSFAAEPDFYTQLGEKIGAERGWMFDMGTLFYIKSFDMLYDFKPGIDVVWLSFYTNPLTSDARFLNRSIFAGFKIGVFFSYSPVDNLFIDIRYKLAPTFSFIDFNSYSSLDFYEDYYGGGIRNDLGISFRYKPFMLGFFYNFGNLKLGSYRIEEPFTMSSSTFNFEFGFSF